MKTYACIALLPLAFAVPTSLRASGPPTVGGASASHTSVATANVSASILPNGLPTTVYFEYGPSLSYGSTSTVSVLPALPGTNLTTFLSLNGTNQDAVVPGFGSYAPTNEITVEFWQWANPVGHGQSTFILNPDNPADRLNAHVPWSDGTTYWDFGNIGGSGRVAYITNAVIGGWNHFALVSSLAGNYMRIYRNGVLEAQKSSASSFQRYASDLLLGGGTVNNYFFNGSLCEFRVWRQALDQATIQAWMNGPLRAQHPDWTNLVAYWPMNEGSGTNLLDGSGHGHNATLSSAASWMSQETNWVNVVVSNLAPASVTCMQIVASNSAGLSASVALAFTNSPFGAVSNHFAGVQLGSALFADFLNSGRMDVLVTGTTNASYDFPQTQLWHNLGNGTFTNLPVPIPGLLLSGAVAADLDNDGYLDLFVSGAIDGNYTPFTLVLHNQGDGTFVPWDVGLPNLYYSAVAAADLDNDGYTDLILSGASQYSDGQVLNPVTELWRNLGNGSFRRTATLPPVLAGSFAVADFDKDGLPDIALTGAYVGSVTGAVSQVWHNNGNWTFTKVADLTGLVISSSAAADFDNDGYPDLLLTGVNATDSPGTLLYRNLGDGTFTNLATSLIPVGPSSVAIADFNNDGLPDVVLTGTDTSGSPATAAFLNLGQGLFTNFNADLPPVNAGALAAGDFDHLGRAGILLAGSDNNQNGLSYLLQNYGGPTNTPPVPPTSLTATPGLGTTVTLVWNPGSDAQTPDAGLTYNLRIGTTPGGSDILSPESDLVTGWRRVPRAGNCGQNLSRTLTLRSGGTYYWSVQTVDSAYAGSGFASERSFSLGLPLLQSASLGQASFTYALLNAAVIPNLAPVVAWFQWGTTTNYGNATTPEILPAGTNAVSLALLVAPLQPGATYYYRLAVSNAFATLLGPGQAFTTPANSPPLLSDFTNLTLSINASSGPLAFTIGDAQTPASQLAVTAGSSDPNLVPPANLVVGGSDTNRTLTLTTTNRTGVAAVFVSVSDGIASTTKAFVVTITTNSLVPPPPGLVGIVQTPDRKCVLTYNGVAGFNYTLQTSTNLTQWSDLASVPGGNGAQFTVTNAAAVPRQFFRLRYPWN